MTVAEQSESGAATFSPCGIPSKSEHGPYYCAGESSISGEAAGLSGSQAIMPSFDPGTYPQHMKEALRESTQLFHYVLLTVCFSISRTARCRQA